MRGGSARLLAIVLACAMMASLSGCGFRPVYGGGVAQELSGMRVSTGGDDRLSFLIGNAVREQAGAGDSPYAIVLRTRVRQRGLGRAGDGRATRYALQVTVSYTLRRTDGRDIPSIRGRVVDRVMYEAPNDPFALVAARSQAEQRAAETLGLAVIRDAGMALQAAQDPALSP